MTNGYLTELEGRIAALTKVNCLVTTSIRSVITAALKGGNEGRRKRGGGKVA